MMSRHALACSRRSFMKTLKDSNPRGFQILKSANNWEFHIRQSKYALVASENMNQPNNNCLNTVDQVVDDIIADLTLAERVGTADLDENEFRVLELTLGKLIRYKLDQLEVGTNEALRDDCISRFGKSTLNDADAAAGILKEVWKRLKETHRLRVVK